MKTESTINKVNKTKFCFQGDATLTQQAEETSEEDIKKLASFKATNPKA